MSGSELQKLCEGLRIKCVAEYGGVEVPDDGWAPGTHPYKCRLTFKRRSLTVPFFMGSACEREPTAADVLACLTSDVSAGEQTFEDYCSDFGADPDSRTAERTWTACARMAPKVRRFLGESFDAVASAEH